MRTGLGPTLSTPPFSLGPREWKGKVKERRGKKEGEKREGERRKWASGVPPRPIPGYACGPCSRRGRWMGDGAKSQRCGRAAVCPFTLGSPPQPAGSPGYTLSLLPPLPTGISDAK